MCFFQGGQQPGRVPYTSSIHDQNPSYPLSSPPNLLSPSGANTYDAAWSSVWAPTTPNACQAERGISLTAGYLEDEVGSQAASHPENTAVASRAYTRFAHQKGRRSHQEAESARFHPQHGLASERLTDQPYYHPHADGDTLCHAASTAWSSSHIRTTAVSLKSFQLSHQRYSDVPSSHPHEPSILVNLSAVGPIESSPKLHSRRTYQDSVPSLQSHDRNYRIQRPVGTHTLEPSASESWVSDPLSHRSIIAGATEHFVNLGAFRTCDSNSVIANDSFPDSKQGGIGNMHTNQGLVLGQHSPPNGCAITHAGSQSQFVCATFPLTMN